MRFTTDKYIISRSDFCGQIFINQPYGQNARVLAITKRNKQKAIFI